MQELATADKATGAGRFQRVTVYRCDMCNRVDSRGESCDPFWVSAKNRLFLDLRREAYQQAGLEADPAIAVFDSRRKLVSFG